LYYPNRLARAFFIAMDEVMGQTGLKTLLETAGLSHYAQEWPRDNLERRFDFAEMAAIHESLESMYGVRGGRGLALKIGRAAFANGFREFGVLRGLGDAAFRALPLPLRLDYGLRALVTVLNNFSDQTSSVETEGKDLLFISEVCPMAWGRSSDKPVCHAMSGILQECLRWATNGHEFYVREIACRASGAEACVFRINKQAIGEVPRSGL
jgi:hypothetical protein